MQRFTLAKPKRREERRGAAVVEFAMVAPLLFMLVFGVIEFGQGFMVGQLLNSAARDAVRVAIADGSTNADVQAAALDVITNSTTTNPADVTINITVTPAPGNPDPGNEVANANKRDLCTVDIQVSFSDVSLVTGQFLEGVPLRGNCSMRHE